MTPEVRLVQGDTLDITFRYDPDRIAKVKSLSGRRWHPTTRCWTAPLTVESVTQLKEWGFMLSEELLGWLSSTSAPAPSPAAVPLLPLRVKHKKKVKPYQHVGASWIEARQGRAILGDDMGLGKTLQYLAWVASSSFHALPAVVVTTASNKLTVAEEVAKWTNLRCWVVGPYDGAHLPQGYDIYAVNYDVLAVEVLVKNKQGKDEVKYRCRQDVLALRPQTVVFDECHYIKNKKTQRTQAAIHLGRSVPYLIGVSGTPIVNRPIEFFNVLNLVDPVRWGSYWRFAQRYCAPKHNGFGWVFTGASNTQELHQILTSTCMIRRLKEEVLPELPRKRRTLVPLEITNRREYEWAEADVIEYLRSFDPRKATAAKRAEALVRIGVLKRLAVKGKLEAAKRWIRDFLDNGQKLVAFAHHQDVVQDVMDEFGPMAVKIDGSCSAPQRKEAELRFQSCGQCGVKKQDHDDPSHGWTPNESIYLLLGTLAAKEGLTLTAAGNTAFLELWEVPGYHLQAEDRVLRISQDCDSVGAYYLVAARTIEEDIARSLDRKATVTGQVLDGKAVDEEDTMLAEIVASLLDHKKTRED